VAKVLPVRKPYYHAKEVERSPGACSVDIGWNTGAWRVGVMSLASRKKVYGLLGVFTMYVHIRMSEID